MTMLVHLTTGLIHLATVAEIGRKIGHDSVNNLSCLAMEIWVPIVTILYKKAISPKYIYKNLNIKHYYQ